MAREQIDTRGRRLFSLSGVVPLAFFLIEHTWANASALRGQDAYVATASALSRIPLLLVVEIALVFAPLAYHALYGVWIMRERVTDAAPPYGRRLALANRAAAMIALAFIAWHFWEFRVHAWRVGLSPEAFHATLVWRLSSTWHGFPVRAVVYLFGVTATVAHFAVSAWGYGVTSGTFATKKQKHRAAQVIAALGSLLFIVSASTVVSLATGLQIGNGNAAVAPCSSAK